MCSAIEINITLGTNFGSIKYGRQPIRSNIRFKDPRLCVTKHEIRPRISMSSSRSDELVNKIMANYLNIEIMVVLY